MGGSIRVLYADTAPTETAAGLERADDRFIVETVTSVNDGLEHLANAEIDCIVSTHDTPEIDAIDFLEAVRAEATDLPVVLFTENGDEALAGDVISAGVIDYLRRAAGTDRYEMLATRIADAVDGTEESSQRRQSALKALHEVATTLQTEKTVTAVCERTVAAAADILEFHMCSVILREGEWLVPYAVSAGAQPDGSRRMRIDQGLAGKTYQRGESSVVADVGPDDETDPAKPTYRSAISVPIGDRGVFQAVSTTPNTFDTEDVELAELLVSHTASVVKQLEREEVLRRQNDRLDAFASIVSHDLRNPLNVAEGRLELARESCDNEHLDDIAVALDRMDALIDDVLTLSRQGEAVRDPEPVSLSELCRESWENVATGGATLILDLDRRIWADRSRLQALLENLFRNSVEHGSTNPASQTRQDPAHKDGDLTVTGGTLEDGTGFYVEDDGTGIPEAERESVFESGYSTVPAGTGLGLAIVSDIVAAHGWNRTVATGADGGARFEIFGVEWVESERSDCYSTDSSTSK